MSSPILRRDRSADHPRNPRRRARSGSAGAHAGPALPRHCRDDREGAGRQLRAERLFALEQALALYDMYQQNAYACDARIEAVLKELGARRGREAGPLPSPRQNRSLRDRQSNVTKMSGS